MYGLSDDIEQLKIHGEFTEMMVVKNENVIFHEQFLNMDFSLNIP